MDATGDTAHLGAVRESDRGQRIQARLDALRISDRQFHDHSGIDRKTLRRAVANDPSVRENTFRMIEEWLDRLARRAASLEGVPDEVVEAPAEEEHPHEIRLELEGVLGIKRIVASGPAADPEAVARAAMALIQSLKDDREAHPGDGGAAPYA